MIDTGTGKREDAKLEIAEEILRSFGELRFVAQGVSMIPAIFPGDELIVRRESIEDARSGDVVLFRRGGRLFAHRVVACTGTGEPEVGAVITRGDALAQSDAPITVGEWLGRVSEVIRRGKPVEFGVGGSILSRLLRCAMERSDLAVRWLLRFRLIRERIARFVESARTNSTAISEERA